jgi:aminoglycoside 3-N-acetyltransferase
MNIAITTKILSKKTKNNPLIMHINPIGLTRVSKNNKERFEKFDFFLNNVRNSGGNIAIPSYSYSYVKEEVYDIRKTPSSLDVVSEYLRKKNIYKRTIDPNFSYLLFGNGFSKEHFEISKYSTFGNNSLIDDVFIQDGYLGAIGGALEYLTEIHYLERKLNINYRFDKLFNGVTIDKSGIKNNSSSVFYCRDLELKHSVSFVQLKSDLRESGLIEEWIVIEYNLKIEVVKFKLVYEFIKNKLLHNPKYLWA